MTGIYSIIHYFYGKIIQLFSNSTGIYTGHTNMIITYYNSKAVDAN